jgi:hypothetical protein
MIIGESEKYALKTLREHAEKTPFSFDELLDIKNNPDQCAGNMEEFVRLIPEDFRVVFTHEQQLKGMTRHLSVGCLKHKAPPIEAVKIIMGEMGFETPIEECMIYFEESEDQQVAVNVIELISGSTKMFH